MQKITLEAQPREIFGKKVKSLRRSGFVPAVIYGHDFNPISIQIPTREFQRVYTEAGESTLIYLRINGADHPTIIHAMVKDPLDDTIQHADFYKVRLDEKIMAKIPIVFVGESPAVKGLDGILIKNINEVEVEGFPQDLPHNIEVDVSGLIQFRDHIFVKDLPVSGKIEIKSRTDEIVALIQEPISEEELKAQLETPTVTAEDVEVIKKEKPEEKAAEEPAEKTPAIQENK